MKKMQFLPKLAAYLKEHNYIYTVRKFRYSLLDNEIEIEGVGPCERVHIQMVSKKENLAEYVYRSGFASLDEWWKEIKRMNREYVGPFYLYEIATKELHETT